MWYALVAVPVDTATLYRPTDAGDSKERVLGRGKLRFRGDRRALGDAGIEALSRRVGIAVVASWVVVDFWEGLW